MRIRPTATTATVVLAAAAVVLAGGGVALAATDHTVDGQGTRAHGGSGAASHGGSASHSPFTGGGIEHGQFVTKDHDGKQVTRDVAAGVVVTVSSSAISVKSDDGVTTAFTVSSSTHVHVKGQAASAGTAVTALKPGQRVLVTGTGGGAGPYAAGAVLTR